MTTAPAQAWPGDLDEFRGAVRDWCREHIPKDWRQGQTGASDEEFVGFQKWWFSELRAAGLAVPHWPGEWGGGMSTARQIALADAQDNADVEAPFNIERLSHELRLHGQAGLVPDAAEAERLLLLALDPGGVPSMRHGGIGYIWESGIHVYLKRAVLNRSLFGSPAAHRRRLAARYR